MKKRDDKITDTILADGFEFKGVFYSALNVKLLLLLEKFKSPFYFGGDQMRGLMDYLFLSSSLDKSPHRLSLSEFEDAVYDYASTLSAEDLSELGKLVNSLNEDSTATVVEIKEDAQSKK